MERYFKNKITRAMLALMCCALWGSAFPCVKIGYEWLHIEGTGSQILFAGYRFLLAGVFTYIFACISEKKYVLLKKESVPCIFGQGLLQTTAQYVCFYIGLAQTTGTKGSVINGTNAFFSIIGAHFLLKNEKLTSRKVIGCIIGFGGVVVVNLAPGAWGSGFLLVGEGMVLLSACAYGLSSVTLKMISGRENPVTLSAFQLLFGSVALIVIGALAGGHVQGFDVRSVALLLYMALLSTVAFGVWTVLIKYNSVGQIAIFGFSIPVFGTAFSGIVLGERIFTLQNLLALVLVSIGIVIVNLSTCKKEYDNVQ